MTSTGLYRSCAAIASVSGTFDLISFQSVNFEFILEKVWFGLFCVDRPFGQTDKINGFGLLNSHTNKQIKLFLFNSNCEFVCGFCGQEKKKKRK